MILEYDYNLFYSIRHMKKLKAPLGFIMVNTDNNKKNIFWKISVFVTYYVWFIYLSQLPTVLKNIFFLRFYIQK